MLAKLKHLITAFVGVGTALCAECFIPNAAGAAAINFDGLTAWAPFTSYTEYGFTVSPVSGNWIVIPDGNPGPSIAFSTPPTSTAEIAVTDSGETFLFNSIDLYASITPIPYTFTGLLHGNEVFTTSNTEPNTFGDFVTVSNPYSSAVIDALQVTLTSPLAYNATGLDNIDVIRSTVPESSTWAMLLLGFAGLGFAGYRRARAHHKFAAERA
jgi:hypothetical protein